MKILIMSHHWSLKLVQEPWLQSLILSQLSASSLLILRIVICWVFPGEVVIIWTTACLWVASLHVLIFNPFPWLCKRSYRSPLVSLSCLILDDFIFICPVGFYLCGWQLSQFLWFAALMGIPLKHSKTVSISNNHCAWDSGWYSSYAGVFRRTR